MLPNNPDTNSVDQTEFEKYNKMIVTDLKEQMKKFIPNFEIYMGNDAKTKDRV